MQTNTTLKFCHFKQKSYLQSGEYMLDLSVVTMQINLSVYDALDEIQVSQKKKCQVMKYFGE